MDKLLQAWIANYAKHYGLTVEMATAVYEAAEAQRGDERYTILELERVMLYWHDVLYPETNPKVRGAKLRSIRLTEDGRPAR